LSATEVGPIGKRFALLNGQRQTHLDRQRACAALTIPSALPYENTNESTPLTIPHQSLGARGIQNITSAITTALLPPLDPPFRLMIDPDGISPDEDIPAAMDAALQQREQRIMQRIQSSNIRIGLHTTVEQLAVASCAAVYVTKDLNARVYRLDQFVVQRQPDGTPLEVITRDYVDVATLPIEVINANQDLKVLLDSDDSKIRQVALFTSAAQKAYYEKTGSADAKIPENTPEKHKWVIVQEVCGQRLNPPTTRKRCPFVLPRWKAMAGEHYARSMVEDLLGDLRTYDGLQKSINEAAAASSRVVFLVNPTGYTKVDDINNAENGEYVPGKQEDVLPLVADLSANLQTAVQQAQVIENRLGYAFLLNSAIQPDVERPTATQIRILAQELDGGKGGIYTHLSRELMLPLIELIIERMIEAKELEAEMDDAIKPVIVTGFEALGREQEFYKLQTLSGVLTALGPDNMDYLNIPEFIESTVTALNINNRNIKRTEEEVQKIRANRLAQQQAIASLGAMAENQAAKSQ